MRAAIWSVCISAGALTFAALAVFGGRAALGVAFGGAIASANLVVFVRVVQAFLGQRTRAQTVPWAALVMLKLILLFGGVWLILKSGIVDPLALAVGYGALPLGITLGTLFGPKPPDDYDDQAHPE